MLTDRDRGGAAGPLGSELPEGARFVGPVGLEPRWRGVEFPTEEDLSLCVACGLCLPHCPTYRLTGEESASPRGRITAMRSVSEGRAEVDETFASFMDLCLACRACEDVCPSHVPFGRMMERARVEIEPLRPARARFLRWLGLDVALPRRKVLWVAAALQPLARPFLGKRVRTVVPRSRELFSRLPKVVEPAGEARGTVALLTGCVQNRWFRNVNRATIRVLARNGWRVVVPRGQVCCGALHAHNGHLATARKLARRNVRAFDGVETIVVNAAGCAAHLREIGDLFPDDDPAADMAHTTGSRVRDVMAFLHEHGIGTPATGIGSVRVAYHDACHAVRVLHVATQPRALLERVPGLEIVDVPNGDRCCGAAGLYNVVQPEMASELGRQKAEAIVGTEAPIVASANPGCTIQVAAHLRATGASHVEVVHPIELLDRAYAAEDQAGGAAAS